jgi:branched-subunit amino acid ABC-type transport system permease component
VEHFLGFAIPGVPYGCTYAIVAVGLVLTYQATGVFNFAYGAQAYIAAYAFTKLVQNEHMPVGVAFLLSVVVLSPLLGLAFDRLLFSKIPNSNTMAKLVTGISLFVGIPSLLAVLFGSSNTYSPPSILFNPNTVYFHIAGTPVNGIYITTIVTTAVILVALVGLMRFTSLGLQMRGAVESRRLIELDGVNAGRVVATAWMISGVMAGLAGVLLAPIYGELQFSDYAALMVAAFAAAAWAILRSMPIAALVGIVMGVVATTLQGYLPVSSVWSSAVLTSLPFIVLVLALLLVPGLRKLDSTKDPLSSVDPPTPPSAATIRAPQLEKFSRYGWYVVLAVFVVSMLTWLPTTWENVFNAGLVYSVVFLSITLITGMGGQLSLAQATLAGVGAFTAAQLATHLGLNLLLGGLVGAVAAALVATVLAFASVRLRGLGLALLTIAAALFFDYTVFPQLTSTNGAAITITPKWVGLGITNPDGHAFFILAMAVLLACIVVVKLVRKGTTGRFLGAMRGSETAAAGMGINLRWQHIIVFAISGAVAGIGGTLLSIQQQQVNPQLFVYELSLVFVVVVVTTGSSTVEGAVQAGFGYVVLQQLLTYVPARLGGNSLVVVFFAFGALTYAAHPEGILEYQKRRSTLRIQGILFKSAGVDPGPAPGGAALGAVSPNGIGPGGVGVESATPATAGEHG